MEALGLKSISTDVAVSESLVAGCSSGRREMLEGMVKKGIG